MKELLSVNQTEAMLREVQPMFPRTKSYTPISHGTMIDIVNSIIKQHGMQIKGKQYSHNKEAKVMTGMYAVTGNGVSDNEMCLQVAFQNSLDKSATAKLAIGTQVMICSNGCVSAEHAFKRKHTGGVDLEFARFLDATMYKAGHYFNKLQDEREVMKLIKVDHRTVAELVGRMFVEQGIITSTQLGIIKREITLSDNFKMFNADGTPYVVDEQPTNTLWNMYNNITESLKVSPARTIIRDHVNTHQFVEKEFNLV